VPDFYQGTELWSFNLVDPDNRRPIDFEARRTELMALLRAFERDPLKLANELVRRPEDGRIKLLVSALALRQRRSTSALYAHGVYRPLTTFGDLADQIIAFARIHDGGGAVVLAGRYFTRLGERASLPVGDAWGNASAALPSELHGVPLRDVFTGRSWPPRAPGADGKVSVPLAEIFAHLPVALLVAT
jgi:(1->4)-alpha-D-glucan 1-alpha-D-glucosylmutase